MAVKIAESLPGWGAGNFGPGWNAEGKQGPKAGDFGIRGRIFRAVFEKSPEGLEEKRFRNGGLV